MDQQICARFPQSDIDEMDLLVTTNKYMNRSDAVRDLVRKGLQILKDVKVIADAPA